MKTPRPFPAISLLLLLAAASHSEDYVIYPEDLDLTRALPDGVYHSPALPPPDGEPIRKYAEDEPGTGPRNFGVLAMNDNRTQYYFLAHRAEYRWNNDGEELALWDVQAWIGGDYNKFWIESEGEWKRGEGVESARIEALYARSISTYWDFRAGVRYDLRPEPQRHFGVLSLQGLAPYFFETEFNAYVDNEGRVSFGLEVEFDIRLTQRLVLQPRFETELAVQDALEYDLGSGFTKVEVGARLRYEISRKFAPYIGVSWETAVGETADLIRKAGGDPGSVSLVAGVRFWF